MRHCLAETSQRTRGALLEDGWRAGGPLVGVIEALDGSLNGIKSFFYALEVPLTDIQLYEIALRTVGL